MSLSHPPAPTHPDKSGGLFYNLAGIAVLVLLLAVGAAYLLDRAGRTVLPPVPALGDGDVIEQTIGGRELSIPRNWFRHGEQMQPGFAGQVDLDFRLALMPDAAPVIVEVTLLPRTRVRTSSNLLDRVYLHRFEDDVVTGVPGLVGKPLHGSEGYNGEVVWYDALAPNPFVAKCMEAVNDGGAERCLRTVHLPSGLAAVFSFDASALQAWRNFDTEMALWLGQIGAL